MALLPPRPPLSARSSFYTRSKASSTTGTPPSRSTSTDASSVTSSSEQYARQLRSSSDDAAIIGMACRLPGAKNPSQLWENLLEQRDLQTKIPENRFNVDSFYHPNGANKGTTNAKYGYFLDNDISEFDPDFFQISGKEAEAMDPQQRMLLEVVYEALENAGITLEEVGGSQTSVFCGCFTNDYRDMTTRDLDQYPKYTATGTGAAILANRISYFYDLHGPSVTIDTACSSSLVGFHMGNQSIRSNESDMAIIVGSALHFDPTVFITMTDLGFLSSDGRCRAFDTNGSGYVRGEGICAVILKRKCLAELDGNVIRALVCGTGSNHDGQKEGITMPNSRAQEALIRKVYQDAGVNPHDTTYFEAHGTGTQAGDPREARAIGVVFAPKRSQPLLVGSIKTNIGHLEGASGLAGIIKTTLSLENGKIPPNMHFNRPNTNIDFQRWKIDVPTKAINWEPVSGIRRASINSFGYGGTNAHAILEEYQASRTEEPLLPLAPLHAKIVQGRAVLLPLTAHTEKAGNLFKHELARFVRDRPEVLPEDLALSLSHHGRSKHQIRSFVVGNEKQSLLKSLEGPAAPWTTSTSMKRGLGFIFTGQGAQWFAMGKQLIEQCPMFRQTIERFDDVMKNLPHKPGWSCITELSKPKTESLVNEVRYSMPLCTAIQVAIVDLLREWGIEPSATVGHSAGEVAAAYAAGILSFDDAVACSYYRAYALIAEVDGRPSSPGAMLAVGMTEDEASSELEAYTGQVCVAAINSPTSLTLSGDAPAIGRIKADLEKKGIFVRQLQVEKAFHSHHMAPYASILEYHLRGIKPRPAKCRMFSSVTARLVDATKIDGDYFVANLVGQVRYSDALIGTLLDETEEQCVDMLIEIGPHPALKGPSRQTMQALKLDIPYIASLTRGVPDFEALLSCAGQIFAHGYPVKLDIVNSDLYYETNGMVSNYLPGRKLTLPSYTWDHRKYWAETRLIKNHRLQQERHSILGSPLPAAAEKQPHWRTFLRQTELPWLSHHMIEGKVIFPAAGYITMAIEAATRRMGSPKKVSQIALRDVAIKSALHVSNEEMGTEVLLEMQPVSTSAKRTSDSWHRFIIGSYNENGQYNDNCYGLISVEEGPPSTIAVEHSLKELRKRSNKCVPLQKYYDHLDAIGLQYGDDFRLVCGNVESGSGFAMAPIAFTPETTINAPSDRCILHPTFLDASFHPLFAGVETLLGRPLDEPFVPTFMKSMRVSGSFPTLAQSEAEQRFWVCANTRLPGPRAATCDITVRSADCTEAVIEIQGLEATALGSGGDENTRERSLFFRTRWQPAFGLLGGSRQPLHIDGLSRAMDIFVHQFPDCKILHVTSDLDAVRELLRDLGGRGGERRRFQRLTPYSPSSDTLGKWRAIESEWSGLIDLTEPKTEDFDLIVLSEATTMDVQTYLKPDGYVISNHVDFDTQGFSMLMRSQNLDVWHRTQDRPSVKPLTLVMPSFPSEDTKVLASIITANCQGPVTQLSLEDLLHRQHPAARVVVLASLDEDLLFEKSDTQQTHFEALKKLLTSTTGHIIWILRGAIKDSPRPEQAIVLGLVRVARNENDNARIVVLDVDQQTDSTETSERILKLFDYGTMEEEIAERNGTLYIPRVEVDDTLNSKLPDNSQHDSKLMPFGDGQPLALKIGKVGLLETLTFALDEEIVDTELAADEVEIEVKASAVNFRDVAASMGIIDDFRLGDECSGVVLRVGRDVDVNSFRVGDRISAWRPGQGAHRSVVRNPASLCYKLKDISFAAAAAFPCVLTTAYYAFVHLARLQPGEHVLIHGAAGGVGQMAVQLAQNIGAIVIATCGSQAKRDILKSTYGLNDDYIFSSRDSSFVQDVLELTNGKGVEVVLNSLAGDLLHYTWACIARFGRFVEIGKRDIHENAKLDMEPFRKNVSFASLDLITVFEHKRSLGAEIFRESCKLVEDGAVRLPETITELPYAEAEKAFRLLQLGKQTGKLVLVPKKGELVPVSSPVYRDTKLFSPDKVYLLSGGLGGLGRTLAEWMVRKGARHLAFLSRSGASRIDAQSTVEWLEARDVRVSVFTVDVTDFTAVTECITSIGGKLAGVFHAAAVLQDSPFESMSFQQWERCLLPKVRGAYNLHRATLGTELEFFTTFSSVSATIGTLAQANYAAANCYLDALIRHRRQLGLVGSTMNSGMVTGVGMVAENEALEKWMIGMGSDPVSQDEFLYQVEEAVESRKLPVSSPQGFDQYQTITGVNLLRKDFYWSSRSLFRNLYSNHDLRGDNGIKAHASLSAMLQNVEDADERSEILTSAFVDKIGAVLGVSADSIQPSNPLSMYGLDSIVAVEFRKWFSKTISVDVALFDILSSKSISTLVQKAAGLMVIDAPSSAPVVNLSTQLDTKGSGGSLEHLPHQSSSEDLLSMERPHNIPMSTFQRRMWYAHMMTNDKSSLNITVTCHMKGQPDVMVFKNALDELRRRNEMLRTAYFEGEDFAEQQPMQYSDSDLVFQDFSTSPEPDLSLHSFTMALRQREMDIEKGEVMMPALIRVDQTRFVLFSVFHHIVMDRGSSKALIEQFVALYEAMSSGKDVLTVPQPRLSYIDFSLWHESHLQSSTILPSLQFWRDGLRGASPASKLLPFAKTERPEVIDPARSAQNITLGLAMLKRMKRVCAGVGVTPFQFLLAAFRSFVYRYTEEEDLTILIVDGNRPRPDLEDVLGFFANMIPVRLQSDLLGSFDQLLASVKRTSLQAIEHSKVPFDVIVDAVQVERSSKHFPLAQIVLNYQMHGQMPRFTTKDFVIDKVETTDIPTACEVALEALEDPLHGLDLRLQYSTALYADDEMERFFDNFATFMTSLIQDHRQPISEVELCGPEELENLNAKYWNTGYSKNGWDDMLVGERILQVADRNPHALAIQTADGEQVSYTALVERAQRVAAALEQMGVVAGQIIGVLARPSSNTIVAMIGALLARCGYLPMDPDFATERLAFMTSDSCARIILIGDELADMASLIASKSSSMPQLVPFSVALSCRVQATLVPALPDNPFYTIYTSGSTGQPKGVVLTQANTQQMLSTLQSDYGFSPKDKFLHQSSISFDLSIVQIFSSLTCGGTVCIALTDVRKSPTLLAKLMVELAVTVTYFTPTLFALLIEHAAEALRQCSDYRLAFFAGERLTARLVQAFQELNLRATLLNTWSPSEVVVQTTIHKVTMPSSEVVNLPIGYPLANCRHYILDSHMNPLPPTLVGEICVGGAQVGTGYLNRPKANALSFLTDRFCSEDDVARGWTRFFRTGDKGRFLPDGQLEFHGRIAGDKQIKLRGFRVDLGEVEHRLFLESSKIRGGKLVGISVTARSVEETANLADERQIIAFVVCSQTLSPTEQVAYVTTLHEAIGQHLNAYMLPNGYQFLSELPVTVGGKVDVRNLLVRHLQLVFPSFNSTTKESPEASEDSHVLRAIYEIFKQVLKLPKEYNIHSDDDFFELGGQSILLLRLQSKLKRRFEICPTLPELFKNPTPAFISQSVGQQDSLLSQEDRVLSRQESTNWREEAKLPFDERYTISHRSQLTLRPDVTEVLMTGVDSFIGLHLLSSLLSSASTWTIHVLGSEKQVDISSLLRDMQKYKLIDSSAIADDVASRVRCVKGTLAEPQFGLDRTVFCSLGHSIQSIFHLGGPVSLLKSYADLKQMNVNTTLDIIELASQGQSNTEIHYLSTWSVPHLQSHHACKFTNSSIDAGEKILDTFEPPCNSDLVYFKARWVTEQLLSQAASRNFHVSVYRASAVTASSATHIPEPDNDIVRPMLLEMIATLRVPDLDAKADAAHPFVLDFIPVDHLVRRLCAIAQNDTAPRLAAHPAVYHLTNPRPLLLRDLPALMPQLRADGKMGTILPSGEWLALVEQRAKTEEERLRGAAVKAVVEAGHVMFALQRTETSKILGVFDDEDKCPSVDADYLRAIVARSRQI